VNIPVFDLLVVLALLCGLVSILALLYMNWRVGPVTRISVRQNHEWRAWFERKETCRRAKSSRNIAVVAAWYIHVGAKWAFLILFALVVIAALLTNLP
jgi:hypothetical protein